MHRMFDWIDRLSKRTFFSVIAFIIVSLSIASVFAYRATEDVVTVKVSHKERINGMDKVPGKYLVFSDGETFEIVDSLMYLQFRSSDMYGRLKAGETYRFKVVGWRIPIMSSYRTIVEVSEGKE